MLVTALPQFIGCQSCAKIAEAAMAQDIPLQQVALATGLVIKAQYVASVNPLAMVGSGVLGA